MKRYILLTFALVSAQINAAHLDDLILKKSLPILTITTNTANQPPAICSKNNKTGIFSQSVCMASVSCFTDPPEATITITNTGNTTVSSLTTEISRPPPGTSTFTTNSCEGISLAPFETCTMVVNIGFNFDCPASVSSVIVSSNLVTLATIVLSGGSA